MNELPTLAPLGVLGPHPGGPYWSDEGLAAHAGELPRELVEPVATYLASCPMILAWLGISEDRIRARTLLGFRRTRFQVPGGLAILTDGTYYWRYDAVQYVRHYRVGMPAEAIAHMRLRGWQPPVFDETERARLDHELITLTTGGSGLGE